MSPVLSGNGPGYSRLSERVQAAVYRLQEEPGVEFKQSCPWSTLKFGLIRTGLAMANLRDGGLVIVGIQQRDDSWNVTGIDPDHLSTFDPDDVRDTIDSFASPYITCELVTMEAEADDASGSRPIFLVLDISEFDETPVVCKKDGPSNSKIQSGVIYYRPFTGRPSTRRIVRAEDLHSLLELAAEKRAARIVRVAQKAGMVVSSGPSPLDEELEGL